MTTDDFSNKVVEKLSEEIIDLVFLYKENNKKLMHDYLRLVSDKDLDIVNKALGKKIKEKYNVDNIGRMHDTKSKLIQSYTKHTVPK